MDQIQVMIVDDDSEDRSFLMSGFKSQNVDTSFICCSKGDEAAFLLKNLHDSQHVRQGYPDLIFLDMRMPGKDGFQILAELKEDLDLAHIPIMMLSASILESEQNRCRAAGCALYFNKPMSLAGYDEVARLSIQYLIELANIGPLPIAV